MTKKAFTRHDTHFPASVQNEMLRKAGATVIFDDFEELLAGLRKSELIMVVDLRALGSSVREIATSMAMIREKGAGIVQAATGFTAFDAGVEMAWEATRLLANDRRGGQEAASRIGREGHLAALKSRMRKQRPWGDCQLIWHDKSLTTVEAVEKINEGFAARSKSALYNKLGPREVLPGRRR